MSEKITSEAVSRRTVLSVLAAAVGLAVPTTVLTVPDAEAQRSECSGATSGAWAATIGVKTGVRVATSGGRTGAQVSHSSCDAGRLP